MSHLLSLKALLLTCLLTLTSLPPSQASTVELVRNPHLPTEYAWTYLPKIKNSDFVENSKKAVAPGERDTVTFCYFRLWNKVARECYSWNAVSTLHPGECLPLYDRNENAMGIWPTDDLVCFLYWAANCGKDDKGKNVATERFRMTHPGLDDLRDDWWKQHGFKGGVNGSKNGDGPRSLMCYRGMGNAGLSTDATKEMNGNKFFDYTEDGNDL